MKRFAAMAIALLTLPLAAQTPEEKSSVQYLKGLTPLQMQRTMNFIRASLGVHCDYCHVNTEEAGWDWKSDAKPEKLAAREMIAMTIETNTKFFKGHTDVTCNTCHRGATRPVGLPVLPQAQPPFPTPKSERPKLPSRDEVVNKYAAALGNVD
ncbi:MAG: photosynthetic reaction center cytochrome c subunit, partial [Thermoanaerobaculia bacterium]|nr:photosynthetic reaction center cytochrome c subunit [Thermoanaerobaculia bacterium]